MRLFKKEIKPCVVNIFGGCMKQYLELEDKWYPDEDKNMLIEKYQKRHIAIDFRERLIELPDMMCIPAEEYLEWKRYKQAVYEDLHG